MKNKSTTSNQLCRDDELSNDSVPHDAAKENFYKIELIWPRIIAIGLMHIAAVYGAYLVITSAKVASTLFAIFLYVFSMLGVTAGAHRLWSHRTYKAKWPLRLLLVVMHTVAWQFSIINFVRDHRMHHKYSDTNADPHNPNRGFFYAHIGWALCRKHPDVKEKGKNTDMSDVHNDPMLRFQEKYHVPLVVLIAIFVPTIAPVYFWNESWRNAFFVCVMMRTVLLQNAILLINSAAHRYGDRPYDKNLNPTENFFCSFVTSGEGWHNYHHAFPWDYRTAEFGNVFSLTTAFIDIFAKIGWAYDLKCASAEAVQKRVKRTGDPSYKCLSH